MNQKIKTTILREIENKVGYSLSNMEIQRYFYVLQVKGVDLGYIYRLGLDQPYSTTLSKMLEFHPFQWDEVIEDVVWSNEFLIILEEAIDLLNGKTEEKQMKICRNLFRNTSK